MACEYFRSHSQSTKWIVGSFPIPLQDPSSRFLYTYPDTRYCLPAKLLVHVNDVFDITTPPTAATEPCRTFLPFLLRPVSTTRPPYTP